MKLYFSAFLLSLVSSSNAASLRANKRALSDLSGAVDSLKGLNKCTLFQMSSELSDDKMRMDNRGSVYGDVCLGKKGELNMDKDTSIHGFAYHEGENKFDPKLEDELFLTLVSHGAVSATTELLEEKEAVSDVSTKLGDSCTDDNTVEYYNPEAGETLTLSDTDITVFCFTKDVEFKDGDFHIDGSGTLVMNIEGKLTIDKAKIFAENTNIIFNVVGNDDVHLKGSCTDGVCVTDVEATILAKKKIEISDSTLIGYAYTPGEIVVKDDSIVAADRDLIPTAPAPAPTSPPPAPTSPVPAPTAPAPEPVAPKVEGPTSSAVCPNSYVGLAIEGCSILQASDSMENGKVEIRGDMATIYGDVCVGLDGELKMDDHENEYDEYIEGTVRLEGVANDIIYHDLEDIEFRSKFLVSEGDASIEQKKLTAGTKSLDLESDCNDENTIKEWKSEAMTIEVDGKTVKCIEGDVEFKSGLFTIVGDGELIMNIGKKLLISDATIKATGEGMSASKIVFNMMSTDDDDVKIEKGSIVDGTILGMNRKIEVIESRINGQLISNQDIKVKYGSMVVCDNAEDNFPVRTGEESV